LQQVLDSKMTTEEQGSFVAELKGHVAEGLRCPHANYLLQKCITAFEPDNLQPLVDELAAKGPGAVSQVARHKYGCRIIQRLLETMPHERLPVVFEGLLANAAATCANPYGNYAMQHLVVYGSRAHRRRVADVIAENIHEVHANRFVCAVVIRLLTSAEDEERAALALAIAESPDLLSKLPKTSCGRIVASHTRDIRLMQHETATGKNDGQVGRTGGDLEEQFDGIVGGA